MWVKDGDGPDWLTGGSYLVTRKINMRIETWDRESPGGQDSIIGRSKGSGGPMSGDEDFDEIDFSAKGADGAPLIAEKSHVRLAHPDANLGARLLRRGYNFVDGSDGVGKTGYWPKPSLPEPEPPGAKPGESTMRRGPSVIHLTAPLAYSRYASPMPIVVENPKIVNLPVSAARIAELTGQIRTTIHESRTTISPLNGLPVADIPVSSVADVQSAFDAARNAQITWARTSLRERKKALLKLHDLVLEHQDELMDLIQIESGKTRAHAFDEIAHVALTARFYARRLHKQIRSQHRSGVLPGLTRVRVNVVPKGVVGIISPWNYPLTMAISDGIPAIAAGNAVVHKPDSQSPLIALAGVELLRKAGIPADLWQVVSGAGSVIGTSIVERADYVCFTGSTATGKIIAKQAAERLISCSLELGGKNPMIVLDSAHVDKAAQGAVNACFSSAGQLCVSIERMYVADAIFEEFKATFVEKVRAMKLGATLEWGADMGSLVSQSQLETIEKHVDDAVANGATVLAGGKARPDLGPFFFEPTVLEGVTPAAECFAEETFGPLVSLYRFTTDDEAVALANQGEYGLNASIFGHAGRARELAGRIKAGTVNINEGFAATFGSLDAPMGGMRQSGLGRRHGAEGILRYTEPQSVASQSLIPVSGPTFLSAKKYAAIMTFALRFLRRTPRA